MSTKFAFVLAIVLQVFLIYNVDGQPATFDITKYGAKADSPDDMSEALLSAWKEACASTSPSKILIPKGTFNLNQAYLEGPCKGPIEIQVEGTLTAPEHADQLKDVDGEWVTFRHVDQLTMYGSGVFDGRGASAWAGNDCGTNSKCKKNPYNLSFSFVTKATIRDITTKDSKNFHVMVFGCKDMTFLNFHVSAPGDSVNTDGIHLGKSSNISITSTKIETGDDCISIGDGCTQISITDVTCGPGHGISIGSLGKYKNEEEVNGIFVKNCTFLNTDNGARVKTWPDSEVGVATDIHFEDIVMQDVKNPIIVDQEYCPYNQCKLSVPSRVKLSKISFKNIRGTSTTPVAVKLVCSKNLPCDDLEIGDIDLTYKQEGIALDSVGGEGPAAADSTCANVKPTFSGKQNPPICAS